MRWWQAICSRSKCISLYIPQPYVAVESWSTKARQPQIRGGPQPRNPKPAMPQSERGEGGGPTLPLLLPSGTGAQAHESEDEERERMTSNSSKSTTQGEQIRFGERCRCIFRRAWGHLTDDGGAHGRLLLLPRKGVVGVGPPSRRYRATRERGSYGFRCVFI